MIKKILKWKISKLAWLKVFFFLKNKIGPESSFSWSVDIRYTKLAGKNYIGKGSVVHNCDIGDYSYVGENSRFINVKVGMFSSIGSDVKTSFGRHPYNFFSQHPATYSKIGDTPTLTNKENFENQHKFVFENYFVSIGHDVWIGDNVNIFDGIEIGNGAVIGANSLVTKNVPPYSIVSGIPAKVIKYRFSKSIRSKLLELKWWYWDKSIIKKATELDLFNGNIEDFFNFTKNNKF